MIYIVIQAVLQSAWAPCTKEHCTSDHPGNTLPFCKPMHEALMQQLKLVHNLTRGSFSKNSTNSLHNDLLKSTMLILQKWMAPTQPRFQTAFWDCYMIVMLCLNHPFYCSYNMIRCRQLPTTWPFKQGVALSKLVRNQWCCKMAGLGKVI